MTIPVGTYLCPRDGRPLVLACQLCPISPIYWRRGRGGLGIPEVEPRCRVIGRAEERREGIEVPK